MSIAVVHTRARVGVEAPIVVVEVHISSGMPGFFIVGLPETVVRESKDRVRSALVNSKFKFPQRRITINLAPADLPKEGSRFDLPIALGILAASDQIPVAALSQKEFLGELALTGALRGVCGILPAAIAAAKNDVELFVPAANQREACLPQGVTVRVADHLLKVCAHLLQQESLPKCNGQQRQAVNPNALDLVDVQGQQQAKRALTIAAAGGHSMLMFGPPGTGKTMLASRLPGILPPLTETQALEVAAIYSITFGKGREVNWLLRPFRAPHHTTSAVALVGGGSEPKPGEISLAHHGVLFLDELPEFDRKVLEVLREPLEKGEIAIARAKRKVEFPANFQLLAAMNPCPCGYLGDNTRACQCTAQQIQRYHARISGPLLDRIDLHVEVPRLPNHIFRYDGECDIKHVTSAEIRRQVMQARSRQNQRGGKSNSQLLNSEIREHCGISTATHDLLEQAMEKLCLSARGYFRILKVGRTIADLDNSDNILEQHIMESIGYRKLDRLQPFTT